MGNDRETTSSVGCFGCSASNAQGLRLAFRREGDEVEAQAVLGDAFAGYDGLLHGGIVSTLLDEAMGWAILEIAGRFAVTRSLRVEFRRPAMVGRPLTVRARIASRDADGALHVEAGLLDHRGRSLATGQGVWVPVRESRVLGSKGSRD